MCSSRIRCWCNLRRDPPPPNQAGTHLILSTVFPVLYEHPVTISWALLRASPSPSAVSPASQPASSLAACPQCVRAESVGVVCVCLICPLHSTCKGHHVAFVFLRLALFGAIRSRSWVFTRRISKRPSESTGPAAHGLASSEPRCAAPGSGRPGGACA